MTKVLLTLNVRAPDSLDVQEADLLVGILKKKAQKDQIPGLGCARRILKVRRMCNVQCVIAKLSVSRPQQLDTAPRQDDRVGCAGQVTMLESKS